MSNLQVGHVALCFYLFLVVIVIGVIGDPIKATNPASHRIVDKCGSGNNISS